MQLVEIMGKAATRDVVLDVLANQTLLVFINPLTIALRYCPICGYVDGGVDHWTSHGDDAEEMEEQWSMATPFFLEDDDIEDEEDLV